MLRMMTSARIVNLNVNKCPSAERIPELASASGIAPSSTPCGQMYLQKKGSHDWEKVKSLSITDAARTATPRVTFYGAPKIVASEV